MKLEETEILKYVNNIQTTTSRINKIHDSDIELASETDTALLNVDRNKKIIRTNHKNTENQINHFTNTWKKTKTYH